MKMRHTLAVAAVAVAALLSGPHVALAGGNASPLAPANMATYKELGAKWWQWAAATPFSNDGPFGQYGTDCGQNQPNGNTWFLVGQFSPQPAERTCTIPPKTRLFFPTANVECSSNEVGTPWYGGTVAERRACVERFPFTPLYARLDGRDIVADLSPYTVVSPNFPINAVAGNAAGIGPVLGKGFSVSKGNWLLLAPLSPGVHTLEFAGQFASGWTPTATYHLTVLG